MKKTRLGISFLFFVAALLIVPFVGTLIVVGAGHFLNEILGIGLIPSAVIFLGTLFTGIVAFGLTFIAEEIKRTHFQNSQEDWDEEDYSDEEDEEFDSEPFNDNFEPLQSAPSAPKAGRNQPCPCGSKRKYKACCLNKQIDRSDDVPF